MKHTDSISSIQLAVIVAGTMIGVSLLVLPRFIVERVGTAAPLATVVGVIVSLMGLIAIGFLGKMYPKHTIVGQSKIVLGKYTGNVINSITVMIAIVFMGLETRQFAEVLKGALLPNTPIEVSIVMMIFLCASVGFSNVSNFANIHFFYLPFMVITIFLVLLFAFENVEMYHVLPILGHNVSPYNFLNAVTIICQAISNVFIISILIPYIKHPSKIVKNSVVGFLLGSLIIFLIITMSLAVFGEFEIQNMLWPTLILGRMVQVPGDILARIDAIFLITWIFATFTTLLSYYFFFVHGLAEIVGTKNYKLISIIGYPIAFIAALAPVNIYQVYNLILLTSLIGILFTIVFPILLLIIAKIRKKKGQDT